MAFQERLSLPDRSGNQLQRLVRPVSCRGASLDEVSLKNLQDVSQIRGIRAVRRLDIAQPERLAGLLHEVEQLVRFEQRHERLGQPDQIAVHQTQQRRPAGRHGRAPDFGERDFRRRGGMRLEHERIEVRDAGQRPMDEWLHLLPIEAAEPAAQRRQRDGANPAALDLRHQRRQPDLDVVKAAPASPVPLGRKVDDVTRHQFVSREDEHPPRLNRAPVAGFLVRLEVGRKPALERQRDATAHDADAIDAVDQRLAFRSQQIARHVSDPPGLHT